MNIVPNITSKRWSTARVTRRPGLARSRRPGCTSALLRRADQAPLDENYGTDHDAERHTERRSIAHFLIGERVVVHVEDDGKCPAEGASASQQVRLDEQLKATNRR